MNILGESTYANGSMIQKWRRFPRAFFSPRSKPVVPPPPFHPSISFAPHLNRSFQSLYISPTLYSQSQECPGPQPHPSRLSSKPQISTFFFKSRCFRCGRQGHLARSCTSPVRCYHCGDLGHKRSSCRKLIKERSKLSSAGAFENGEGDDLGSFRSVEVEPHHPVDCMLLDPAVGNYLDKGNLVRAVETKGQPLDLADLSEEVSSTTAQVCVTPKGRSFFGGSFQLGKFFVKDFGLVVSRKINQRLEGRGMIGKGRKTVASHGSFLGKKGFFLFPKSPVLLPISPVRLQLLKDSSPVSLAGTTSDNVDIGPEKDLPPAPFDSGVAVMVDSQAVKACHISVSAPDLQGSCGIKQACSGCDYRDSNLHRRSDQLSGASDVENVPVSCDSPLIEELLSSPSPGFDSSFEGASVLLDLNPVPFNLISDIFIDDDFVDYFSDVEEEEVLTLLQVERYAKLLIDFRSNGMEIRAHLDQPTFIFYCRFQAVDCFARLARAEARGSNSLSPFNPNAEMENSPLNKKPLFFSSPISEMKSPNAEEPKVSKKVKSSRSPKSVFKDFYSDDEPPLKPSHIVKDAVTKFPKRPLKIVSPVYVRRSPRLNKVFFA